MRKPVVALGSMAVSALLAVAGSAPGAAAQVLGGAKTLTWSVVHSPNPDRSDNTLLAVSCASKAACVAVGSGAGSYGEGRTLTESWDGTRWSAQPSPNRGNGDNVLEAVSCAREGACMAVGYVNVTGPGQTLIESWDGSRWRILPSPSPGKTGSALYGVSCVSADACTAVGADGNSSGVAVPLVESWNGARWSVVPSPGTADGALYAVSCTTKNACMAAGCSGHNACASTLAESWDGSRWSRLPSPSPGTFANRFNSVSCASADACTAAGVTGATNGVTASLIESWDGSRWSVVPSPNPGPGFTWFWGVSCASKDSCSAAGFYFTSGGAPRTLIESGDGTRWAVVPTPSPGTTNRTLNGVSCISTTTCTAAGSYYNHNHAQIQSLIESGPAGR